MVREVGMKILIKVDFISQGQVSGVIGSFVKQLLKKTMA